MTTQRSSRLTSAHVGMTTARARSQSDFRIVHTSRSRKQIKSLAGMQSARELNAVKPTPETSNDKFELKHLSSARSVSKVKLSAIEQEPKAKQSAAKAVDEHKLEPDEEGHKLDDKTSQLHVNPFKEKKNLEDKQNKSASSRKNIKLLLDGIVAKCNDELNRLSNVKPAPPKFKLKLPIAPQTTKNAKLPAVATNTERIKPLADLDLKDSRLKDSPKKLRPVLSDLIKHQPKRSVLTFKLSQ